MGFSLKLRGGNLDPERLLQLLQGPVRKAAMSVQAGVMASSPVKTGDLRRSWTTAPAEVAGSRVVSRVGTNKVYARYQNTRTRNRGYVKQGIDATKESAKQVLKDELGDVVKQLWVAR